jgi:hypothetical protein
MGAWVLLLWASVVPGAKAQTIAPSQIQAVIADVSRLSGLGRAAPVRLELLEDDAFEARLAATVSPERYAPRAGHALGFYDGAIVMRRWLPRGEAAHGARTLAHEAVHALCAQHFATPSTPAQVALAEGAAELFALAYDLERRGNPHPVAAAARALVAVPPDVLAMIHSLGARGDGAQADAEAATYMGGAARVAREYRTGGIAAVHALLAGARELSADLRE